jgi:phage terminase large subunit GpA-like protein
MSSPNPTPLEGAWSDGWRTDPVRALSDWADEFVQLSSKDSAEPGPYRTSRTPYVREIADALSSSSPIERVVWMASSQVGKTRVGLNWVGNVIDTSPGPMLMVEPTVETAKRVSKQRVAPMIESIPRLREKVSPARERDSGNTMFEKEFPGGMLIITGANSAVGLRSMPIRFLFLDEVDGYPPDVDGEGDPVSLAEKRAGTFARRKIFVTSTPTIKGLSRIEAEFLATDQRRYFVPCPFCSFKDWLRWERIQWPEGQHRKAQLKCTACGALIDERYKTQMLDPAHGAEWRPTATCEPGRVGYHISALYAPVGWKSWGEIAADFRDAAKEPQKLKTWVNTVLGETWEERGDTLDAEGLKARLEDYPAEVPPGVGVLTASIDVQGDRLEIVVKGWGAGEESWLIALHQVHGDPAQASTWFEADKFLQQQFTHESGRKLVARIVCVDSGGLHTDQVYKFCKPRAARRVHGEVQNVYAIKGVGGTGREILGRPSTGNRYRLKLFPLGVDTAKDTIFSRMHLAAPGAGYLHLPAWADDEYLAQLTSEKAIRKYKRGVGAVREYVKIRERNEGLDLEVYALAALYVLGRKFISTLGELAQQLMAPLDGKPPPDSSGNTPPAAPQGNRWTGGRPGGSWIKDW